MGPDNNSALPGELQLRVAQQLAQVLLEQAQGDEGDIATFRPYLGVSPTFFYCGLSQVYGRLHVALDKRSIRLLYHIGLSPLVVPHVRALVLDLYTGFVPARERSYTDKGPDPTTFTKALLFAVNRFTKMQQLVIHWTQPYRRGSYVVARSPCLGIYGPALSELWTASGSQILSIQATVYPDALFAIAGFETRNGSHLKSFDLKICRLDRISPMYNVGGMSDDLVKIAQNTLVPVLSTLSSLTIWVIPFQIAEGMHRLNTSAFFGALNQHKGTICLETLEIEIPFLTGEATELFHFIKRSTDQNLRSLTVRPMFSESRMQPMENSAQSYHAALEKHISTMTKLHRLCLCLGHGEVADAGSPISNDVLAVTPILTQNTNLTHLDLTGRSMSQYELRAVLHSLTSVLLSLVLSVDYVQALLFDDLYEALPSLESLTLHLKAGSRITASAPIPISLMEDFEGEDRYVAALSISDSKNKKAARVWHLNRGPSTAGNGMDRYDQIACQRAFYAEMKGRRNSLWRKLQYAAIVHDSNSETVEPPSLAIHAASALHDAARSLILTEAWNTNWHPKGRLLPPRKPDIRLTRF